MNITFRKTAARTLTVGGQVVRQPRRPIDGAQHIFVVDCLMNVTEATLNMLCLIAMRPNGWASYPKFAKYVSDGFPRDEVTGIHKT